MQGSPQEFSFPNRRCPGPRSQQHGKSHRIVEVQINSGGMERITTPCRAINRCVDVEQETWDRKNENENKFKQRFLKDQAVPKDIKKTLNSALLCLTQCFINIFKTSFKSMSYVRSVNIPKS